MDLKEFLALSSDPNGVLRRKSKQAEQEFATFQQLLESKSVEQVIEGIPNRYFEGSANEESSVFLDSEYLSPLAFPCNDAAILCLQNLKKRIRLTLKLEILDRPGKLSDWITVYGFCATRVLEGTDANDAKNRVAFIEKSPRVKLPNGEWEYGPKGAGDPYGRVDAYGAYKPSREWCDARLIELGYELPK